ncbi:MAG TPA: T9SS type A sorting domain-containing protein [Candidatus Kapabacteria bacterium]|nr:T9SS type A sorting domain-containing protein [Candidatus Kapabacteria bacterium]
MNKSLVIILFIFSINLSFAQWEFCSETIANPTHITALAIKDSIIFAGSAYSGIYVSTDNGNTWAAKNNGLTVRQKQILSILIKDSDIYLGTSTGVAHSNDNGDNWTSKKIGIGLHCVNSLANIEDNIFAGTDIGVYLSTDQGENWVEKNIGIGSYPYIYSLFTIGSTIYATTDRGGIHFSTDEGRSWTYSTEASPYKPNINCFTLKWNSAIGRYQIFGGTCYSGLIVVSNNDGASWINIKSGRETSCVSAIVSNDSYIFSGTDSEWDYGSVYISTNNGESWIEKNDGLPASIFGIRSFAIKENTIFAGLSNGNGIYRAKISDLVSDVKDNSFNTADIDFYPNPASDYINVPAYLGWQYQIYDLLGNCVQSGVIESDKINISQLSAGVYYLEIYTGSLFSRNKLLIMR